MTYQKINNIFGWLTFIIALGVYTLTVEPTASYWDCGEFIACSYKLQVPHPPGAPFFLLVGRMFSMLSFGDTTQVAFYVNMLSVVSSAFAILFLFWSVTHLAKKVLSLPSDQVDSLHTLLIMGTGLVAALTCTFLDSFWFSAVEAEVYSFSAFFTAFVFWAILKWENFSSESQKQRWLLLIAYMMGLSIGVHLLNLVTLPVLALIMYYNYSEKITRWGIISTLLVSSVILVTILVGIIPGIPSLAGNIEIFFVNTLGMPFGSGIVFFVVVFISALVYGVWYSNKHNKFILNTSLLSFSFILIGYASYGIVLIRSNYNPPIDENNPEDIVSFVSYLKREQYGSRPLFSGPYYTAQIIDQKNGEVVYMRGEDKYEIKDYKLEQTYDPAHTTFLPRMYSNQPNHVQKYLEVTGLKEGEKPKFIDNLKFLFSYQIGHMYLRYFLWNFSGRQSDIQGASPLFFGAESDSVPSVIKTNKGRNIYYGLPLLLGLLGMGFQYISNKKYFFATALLFFITGIALVLYLNSPPQEPRERDYIYAGSFFVFSIWVGFGVLALFQTFISAIKNKKIAALLACVLALGIPTILAKENWDDHDRSDRYMSVASAKIYLDSCAPNSILFTGGDNDTFPLWYAQEVEGYRTDVRVVVLSYFNTDWYVNQMMRPAYESTPLPFGIDAKQYIQGGPNDYLPLVENPSLKGASIDLKRYLQLINQNSKAIQIQTGFSEYNSIPSQSLVLRNIDTTKVKNLLPEYLHNQLVDRLEFRLKNKYLEKKDLAILDLIVHANWERPLYFNYTSLTQFNLDINKYVVQEGICYRLLPINSNSAVNKELMYENMVNKFEWSVFDNDNVYYNEDYRGFIQNFRSSIVTLASEFSVEEDYERAVEVIQLCLEKLPHHRVPFDYFSAVMVRILLESGERDIAFEVAEKCLKMSDEVLNYQFTVNGKQKDISTIQQHLTMLNTLVQTFKENDEQEMVNKFEPIFNKYYQYFLL